MKNVWETIISLFQVMLFISVHSFVTSHPNKLKLCSLSRKQNVFVYLSSLWVLVFLSFLTYPLPDSISYSKHKHFIWLTFMLLCFDIFALSKWLFLIIRIHLNANSLLPHSMLNIMTKIHKCIYCKKWKSLNLRPEEHHITVIVRKIGNCSLVSVSNTAVTWQKNERHRLKDSRWTQFSFSIDSVYGLSWDGQTTRTRAPRLKSWTNNWCFL